MKEVQPIRDLTQIETMKKALRNQSERDYLLFTMGINTGLRVSDLLALTVGDVRGKLFYTLKEQKTGKTKRIRLTSVKDDIEHFTAGKDDLQPLFLSRTGDKAITRIQAYRILNDTAKAQGLEEIGTHTMRKTFGYHFYKRTHDVAMLQMLFNHSAPSITLRYIGITQEEIDKCLDDFQL